MGFGTADTGPVGAGAILVPVCISNTLQPRAVRGTVCGTVCGTVSPRKTVVFSINGAGTGSDVIMNHVISEIGDFAKLGLWKRKA